jgi:hypothetical protein
MVNVKDSKCASDGCDTVPVYNYIGESRGLYCKRHMSIGMVNVKAPKCNQDGCMKQPAFGEPGKRQALYCSVHKHPGMINVRCARCAHDGCMKQPGYNVAGSRKALYCIDHRSPGMVDVVNTKCSECDARAYYGELGDHHSKCYAHKTATMVQHPRKQCIRQRCRSVATHRNGGVRTHCSFHVEEGDVPL